MVVKMGNKFQICKGEGDFFPEYTIDLGGKQQSAHLPSGYYLPPFRLPPKTGAI